MNPFSKIITKFSGSSFVKRTLLLMASASSAQALSFVFMPILTRIYSPEQFGTLAIFISIAGFFSLGALNYEITITLPKEDKSAGNLLVLACIIVLFFACLSLITLLPCIKEIIQSTSSPAIIPFLHFLPLCIFGAGAYQIFSYWAIRHNNMRTIAHARIQQTLGLNVCKLILGLAGLLQSGLIIGQIFGQIAGGLSMAYMALKKNPLALKEITVGNIKTVAKRYIRFPLFALPAYPLTILGTQLVPLALAFIYNAQIVGFFTLGQRAIGTPLTLIGRAIAQVYLADITKISREEPEKLYVYFKKITKLLFLTGIVPIVLIALSAPILFPFIFGQEWQETGYYIQLLAPGILMQFVVSPISQIASVREKPYINLIVEILRMVTACGSLFLAYHYALSPYIAVGVYGIGQIIFYTCIFMLYLYAAKTTG